MKYIFILFFAFAATSLPAQGKFAGSYRALVGKVYADPKQLTILSGFTYRGGSELTEEGREDGYSGEWYSKGDLIVAFVQQKQGAKGFKIVDVLEVKNVQKDQELHFGSCQNAGADDLNIIALAQMSKKPRVNAITAWYLNYETMAIENLAAEKITCLGAVGED